MKQALYSRLSRFIGAIVILISIWATTMTGCGGPSPAAPATVPTPSTPDTVYVSSDPRGIQTATAMLKQVPTTLELAGRISPDPTSVIQVFPPVGGRVVRVEVRPGQAVERGQILAVVNSNDVTSARVDYQRAVVDSQVKEEQRQRAADLFAKGAFSEKDNQQAEADAKMAQAEVTRTLDRLRVLDVDPAGTSNEFKLVAPRAGVILDVGAAPGEYSKSLDAPRPLCTLADLSTVWAVGDIYEKDIAGLKTGQQAEVEISAYPGRKWNGRVAAIADALDPVTRTLNLRVVLPNPGRSLKPEMFATIRLVRSVAPAVVIPASAVIREGTGSYVYVQRHPNQFVRRSVTLGPPQSEQIEVQSGIKAGEVVVSEGALLLRAAAESSGQ